MPDASSTTWRIALRHTRAMHQALYRGGDGTTFRGADLWNERSNVLGRKPVDQSLSPDQRILINDAIDPGLAKHGQCTRATWDADTVAVIPHVLLRQFADVIELLEAVESVGFGRGSLFGLEFL